MKTSFPDILETEKYINGELKGGQSAVFQAKLLVDEELRRDTFFQRMVYRLVLIYHRKKLKGEMVTVHERLFSDPGKATFRKLVTKLFNT